MAGGGTSTPGGWAMGGARSAGGGSRVGSVGRGFSGTRGFAKRPRSASGRPLQTSNIPYRGDEENLYNMIGRPVGGGMTPYSNQVGANNPGYGGSKTGVPIDDPMRPLGQNPLGEGYMQEDYSPFTPGSIPRPPSRLPINGGVYYPPGKFPSKRLPISAYLSPPGSKPWNPYEHGPPAGAGYDPLGEGDWADIMGNPFAGEFGPQDFYEDMGVYPEPQLERKQSICLPGDPNCR